MMNHFAKSTFAVLCVVLMMRFSQALAPQTPAKQIVRYVCSPCGAPCDAKFFDKPGTCPDCGMPLITESEAKEAVAASGAGQNVAILIFDGVQIIDYAGPYEIFGAANYNVFTVGRTKDPITTTMGMTVIPKYSFQDLPQPDVIVVPGGGVHAVQKDSVTLQWIRNEASRVRYTMSVCNGAFILAQAGLLNGLSATTTNGNIPSLRKQFPGIHVVSDKRYVDNGKIITTAGLSAGLDGAFHIVSLISGYGSAQQTALGEEYPWENVRKYVRASLAANLIPIDDVPAEFGVWNVERTEGDTKHWDFILRGTSKKSSAEVKEFFEKKCTSQGWKQISPAPDSGSSKWEFSGPNASSWHATVAVHLNSGKESTYIMKMNIVRGQ